MTGFHDAVNKMMHPATRMVVEEVFDERVRQVDSEGWSHDHDDQHADGQLADAAACYAATHCPGIWPWDEEWWKRDNHPRRRQLVIAASLIVAEIERLDRHG